jgi:hypothetical protein
MHICSFLRIISNLHNGSGGFELQRGRGWCVMCAVLDVALYRMIYTASMHQAGGKVVTWHALHRAYGVGALI